MLGVFAVLQENGVDIERTVDDPLPYGKVCRENAYGDRAVFELIKVWRGYAGVGQVASIVSVYEEPKNPDAWFVLRILRRKQNERKLNER